MKTWQCREPDLGLWEQAVLAGGEETYGDEFMAVPVLCLLDFSRPIAMLLRGRGPHTHQLYCVSAQTPEPKRSALSASRASPAALKAPSNLRPNFQSLCRMVLRHLGVLAVVCHFLMISPSRGLCRCGAGDAAPEPATLRPMGLAATAGSLVGKALPNAFHVFMLSQREKKNRLQSASLSPSSHSHPWNLWFL